MSLVVDEAAGDECRRSHSLPSFDLGATLKNANLTKTSISRANLPIAVLFGATLSGWYVTRHALHCVVNISVLATCLEGTYGTKFRGAVVGEAAAEREIKPHTLPSFVGSCPHIKNLQSNEFF